jgi:tellurite resistance protein TehA-like permease
MWTKLRPETCLGKWSTWFFVACIVFLIIFQILVASGQHGGETFQDNIPLSINALMFAISGISAFFTGILGIMMHKERSILVFIFTIIGLLILLFILGEFLFPH